MVNTVRIYIDESCHLENDNFPVMCVGGTYVHEENWRSLSDQIKRIKLKHHSPTELKWNKVSASRMPFYRELIDFFFAQNSLQFHALLIKNKTDIDNKRFNNSDHNNFYYKNIYYLLLDIESSNEYKVYIDIKDSRGKARLDQLSRVLKRKCGDGKFKYFQDIRSEESQFIQISDFFIGAIVYKQRNDITKGCTVKNEIISYIESKTKHSIICNTPKIEVKFKIWDFQLKK